MQKIVISCGPIPARLDSVKFITNRFKGGLAFRTAANFIQAGYDVTIVMWRHTQLPDANGEKAAFWLNAHVVTVNDVFEYYQWFEDNAANYDAFIMAAAVANLTPSNPWEGKFPSHNYKVGEKFDIQFEIAPRAIDVIKKVNPTATLIGYKLFDGPYEELISAARETLRESKANIIFANTPAEAKEKKYAVLPDNTVFECSFSEHLDLIERAVENRYFRTVIKPLTQEEQEDIEVRKALAVVKMFEKTFTNGYGTVAIPVFGRPGWFATTSRGHRGEPVIVRDVDYIRLTVTASGKATLNAPSLAIALHYAGPDHIIVHRHDDDPLFQPNEGESAWHVERLDYYFPGTLEEAQVVEDAFKRNGVRRLKLYRHGDMAALHIRNVDWNSYYKDFPDKYFSTPTGMVSIIKEYRGKETLELGGNRTVDAKYAFDGYVKADNAINLHSWGEVCKRRYDLVFARNAVNYFTLFQLESILNCCDRFVANTFASVPDEKVTEQEAAVFDPEGGIIYHALRLKDDSIARHSFYGHRLTDYEKLAEKAGMRLVATPYGRNSILLDFRKP